MSKTDTTRLDELCDILASNIAPTNEHHLVVKSYLSGILKEFALTIQAEAVDVARNG